MKTNYRLSLLLLPLLLGLPGVHAVKAGASGEDPAFSKDNFLSSSNWNGSSDQSESKIALTGSNTYQYGFPFKKGEAHKVKFKFNLDSLEVGEDFFVLISGNKDTALIPGNYDSPGVYLRYRYDGASAYSLSGFYTDSYNYKASAITLNKRYSGSIIRDHTLQFETSMVSGYTDGIRIFYQGEQFADWLCYSMVKNSEITDSDNKLYITTYGNVSVTNILSNDIVGPSITYEDPGVSAYAGDVFTFGAVKAIDEVDGELPVSARLFDPSNKEISEKLTLNPDGSYSFKPLTTGEYSLRVLSTDYSTNTSSKKITLNVSRHEHYPVFDEAYAFPKEARCNKKYIIPQVTAHDIDEGEKDNDISYSYEVTYYSSSGALRKASLSQEEDGRYSFLPEDESAYLDDGVGQYFISVGATNSHGTSYLEREIFVKPAIVGEDSVKSSNLFEEANWAPSSYLSVGNGEAILRGNTYYKAGLSLEKGIEMSFTIDQLLDKGTLDNWFSFGISKHPHQGRYLAGQEGIYFMFFYENGAFRANIQYVLEDGTSLDVENNKVVSSSIEGTHTLSITPFDESLDPNMYDNIDIALDGATLSSYEVYKIERSALQDDEGFVYLNYGYYNGNEQTSYEGGSITTNNPIVKLNSLRYSDKTAPAITLLGEVPTKARVGEAITLPSATGLDETDGEIEAYLSSVKDESGVGITTINNIVTFEKSGTYTANYSCVDSSGNVQTLTFEIVVEGSSNNLPLILGISLPCGVLLLGGGALAIILLRKKRKQC